MKKILSLSLALAMCLGLTVSASAYSMGKVDTNNIFSAGHGHTGFIDQNGSLWMWGSGQLGDGTTENSSIPVKVLDNVVSVSCGWFHTAAIKTDGSLWMWGSNADGELGISSATSSHTPVKVLDNVASVSCGDSHTAAIKTDGSLWMWGDNSSGKLGNGSTTDSHTPVKVLDNVTAVSCGAEYTAAVKTDGSLWMWGNNAFNQLGNGGKGNGDFYGDTIQTVPAKVLDNVVAVSCGSGNTSAAIKTDGSLWMWGQNGTGQLGNDTTTDSSTPVKVMDNIVAVSCGSVHTAAIMTDGSLWMWGSNIYGELGNGGGGNRTLVDYNEDGDSVTITFQSIPVKVLDTVATISCGDTYTAAITADGSLWTWGDNGSSQLGYVGGNATTSYSEPIQTVPKQIMGLTAKVPATP